MIENVVSQAAGNQSELTVRKGDRVTEVINWAQPRTLGNLAAQTKSRGRGKSEWVNWEKQTEIKRGGCGWEI